MNVGTFNNAPPENTVPTWLLPCICDTQRCKCNAKLKPDLLCVRGVPYNSPPSTGPNPNITIQFIEFTYCNDRFSPKTLIQKTMKYQSLHDDIKTLGWKIDPVIVISTGKSKVSKPSFG